MTLLDDFARVTRRRPCPLCGRIKYCLVDKRCPDNPQRVICTKVESPRRWKEAGWFHRLGDGHHRPAAPPVRTIRLAAHPPDPRFAALAARFTSNLHDTDADTFATSLGLTAGSLHRLGLGWASAAEVREAGTKCSGRGCWTFPMESGKRDVVGIRLRTPDGFKYSINGGHQGLHLPADLPTGEPLLLAEGPTDTAALLDLGFAAIGRPSCNGGERALVALLPVLRPSVVVAVADCDAPGMRGASALAAVLSVYHPDVRLVRPPEGVKDARAWKLSSPDSRTVTSQINTAIESAARVRLAVAARKAEH